MVQDLALLPHETEGGLHHLEAVVDDLVPGDAGQEPCQQVPQSPPCTSDYIYLSYRLCPVGQSKRDSRNDQSQRDPLEEVVELFSIKIYFHHRENTSSKPQELSSSEVGLLPSSFSIVNNLLSLTPDPCQNSTETLFYKSDIRGKSLAPALSCSCAYHHLSIPSALKEGCFISL